VSSADVRNLGGSESLLWAGSASCANEVDEVGRVHACEKDRAPLFVCTLGMAAVY